MDLKENNFIAVLAQGYSLNNIYILKRIKDGSTNITSMCSGTPSCNALLQGMVRKGLLTDRYKITVLGNKLLSLAYQSDVNIPAAIIQRVTKESITEDRDSFNRWWDAFPPMDEFTISGKKFAGFRAMRVNPEECKIVFRKILQEGYTADEMVDAITSEVNKRKTESLKTGQNNLKYLQNALTYLRQRAWEPAIEKARLNKTNNKTDSIDSFSNGAVDV